MQRRRRLEPGQGKSPLLQVRVADSALAAVVAEAERSGRSRGDVVREALEVYFAERHPEQAGAA